MKKWLKAVSALLAAGILIAGLGGCQQKKDSVGENRLEQILARGYLEVVTEPYFAPNEFIDPSKEGSDQYVGADMELAKYIADELGVELRIIPLEFGAVLSGVTEGKYDMAISALAYTPAREEAMNLSDGYYFDKNSKGHGLLIRTEDAGEIDGPEDVSGRTIVAQSGSLQEMFANTQLPQDYTEFKRVSSTNDGFLMVQEGKADIGVSMFNTAELYIEANPDCGLQMIEGFKFTQEAATDGTRIGMPPGEDELTARVNEIIAEVLASGVFENWYAEYTEYAASLGL
jgi:polar amino acid transport system substrate-binding protein